MHGMVIARDESALKQKFIDKRTCNLIRETENRDYEWLEVEEGRRKEPPA